MYDSHTDLVCTYLATNVTHSFTFSCLISFLESQICCTLQSALFCWWWIMQTGLQVFFFFLQSTGRFQHQRLFIHHIRAGPLHMLQLFSSWICTSHQLHNVTSGWTTVTVSSHQVETKGTKTLVKSWLTVLNRIQAIVNTPQPNQSIINSSYCVQLQKILPDSFLGRYLVQSWSTTD